jgi:hypothetical protein
MSVEVAERLDNGGTEKAASADMPASDAAVEAPQSATAVAAAVAAVPAPATKLAPATKPAANQPSPVAKPVPAKRPQPASEPNAEVEKAPRRGVVHDASKRRSVYWLAAAVAGVACSNLALFAVDVVLDAQEARPTGVGPGP